MFEDIGRVIGHLKMAEGSMENGCIFPETAEKVEDSIREVMDFFAPVNNQNCPLVTIKVPGGQEIKARLVWQDHEAVDKLMGQEEPGQLGVEIEFIWQPSGFVETIQGKFDRVGPTGDIPE
jgi:hypothetical protein